jgi:carotenoid cleavage dioxygenase
MHDFAITDRHAVFLDLPVTFQPALLGHGMPFAWDDGYGARLGVMALDRPGEVRWFPVDPCYVFHVGNAHTDPAGRIVLDVVRYAPADIRVMWAGLGRDPAGLDNEPAGLGRDPAGLAADAAATGAARLHRWTIDPTRGTVAEQPLDDRSVEFPTCDDARLGRPARYLYTVADTGAIVRYDTAQGTTTSHELGPDTAAGEAVFVPSAEPDRGEDDGWLLSIVTRRDGSASQLLVLDATDVAAGPVAAVTLPRGVPAGFHGSWIDDPGAGA